MQLKYLACALVGAVSFCFATPAIADSHGPRIWALTHPGGPDPLTGRMETELYEVDLKTGVYTSKGRLPHLVGGIDPGPNGYWGGIAVKGHDLYFCSSNTFASGGAVSEVVVDLKSGDSNNITHDSGGFIEVKNVGKLGFSANTGGMCVGPDGKFYISVVTSTLSNPQLPPPGDTSALFRFDPSAPAPAAVVGWFKGTQHVGSAGANAFYDDMDFQPGVADLYGFGLISRAGGSKTSIYRIERNLYPNLFIGTTPDIPFVPWYNTAGDIGGLAFRKSTGELYITRSSANIIKYDAVANDFIPAYHPVGINPVLFGCMKVEEHDSGCCDCKDACRPKPCPPRPPHCRWYIPRLHLCLDYMFPVYAQMVMLQDLADTARSLDPAVGRDVEISNLQAIKKLADQRIGELKRPRRQSKGKMRRN